MSAPIFISYSSKDQKIAATIAQALEARGQRCWIASRDVRAGDNFQEAIVRALRDAKVMLLVFSANANNSDEIKKELVLAGRARVTVVPVRVEDVVPNDAFSYELATRQWVDLFQDWETQIEQLVAQVEMILAAPNSADTSEAPPPRPISVAQKKQSSSAALVAGVLILALLVAGGALAWLRPWASGPAKPAAVASVAPPSAASQTAAAPQAAPSAPPPAQATMAGPSMKGPAMAMTGPAMKGAAMKGPAMAMRDDSGDSHRAAKQREREVQTAMAAAPPAAATVAPAPAPAAAPAPQDPDEAAWQNASRVATRDSYNEYVRNFSGGVHLEDAQMALANMILSTPATGSAFDGTWLTIWSCPDRPGYPGYSYRYEGTIRNGVYHGSRGEKGQPSSMMLDGHVDSDGLAAFFGEIVVGSSVTGMGAARGTLSDFHAMAHFDGASGNGKRLEGRGCTLSFARG